MKQRNQGVSNVSHRGPQFIEALGIAAGVRLVLFFALLSAATASSGADVVIPLAKNPKVTLAINPKVTLSLNPNVTPSLNPKVTLSLNPAVTLRLNPDVTLHLNPKVTLGLNPKVTTSLNPNVTPSLNPTISKWRGFYIFDLEGDPLGIAVNVETNDKVVLKFDSQGEWNGYFISNGGPGFNQFDLDGTWVGYAISNSKAGYNIFDRDGNWQAYMN